VTAIVTRGDAGNLHLPDETVDLIVTSPPYFGLRSYQDGGEHYAEQIGAEATPSEYLDALMACTAEWMRVLKPGGSIFVNLGDKYSGAAGPKTGGRPAGLVDGHNTDRWADVPRGRAAAGTPAKSLFGLPWRYAIRCIDELGLILRAEIVWSKCLSGGTRVYAEVKGRQTAIRLHDLCRAYQPEDVRLWTGTRWSQVKAWEATGRSDAQYEVELRSGERIGCTAEHRWPTNRGLLRSDELTAGDVLDTAPLPDGTRHPEGLDDEAVGWFVGLYIAEGSRSEQTIQIAGHVKEGERYQRLVDLAQRFDGTCKVHVDGNKASINLTGAVIRGILEQYVGGRTSKDKHLQPRCWERSNKFLRAVLDGYLSGDGSWDANLRRWTLGFTENDALAEDLRTIAARLGMSLRLRRTAHYGFGQQWPGWGGTLYEDASRRKAPDSQIVAIRASRARQFWDLEIEDEPHLFSLATGVLTHNSNGLPESVTDRVRRSHEQVFHFVKQPRYYSAVDEVREQYDAPPKVRGQAPNGPSPFTGGVPTLHERSPLGKLPGSVWSIATAPLKVPASLGIDHFAAYPPELVRRIVLGWSPRDVCTACGEGRRPVSTKSEPYNPHQNRFVQTARPEPHGASRENTTLGWQRDVTITGYACACPDTTAPSTPGVVLDPFGGTGTTALVASAFGRIGISNDLSADYCRLAQWRTTDPGERARVLGVEKPPVQVDGQLGMFEGIGA
jgi:SAM-dependent methyltransferase